MAHSLVGLEAAGIKTVLHVHDEVICEIDDDSQFQLVKNIMTNAPEWARDLPLAVEGFVADRYQK